MKKQTMIEFSGGGASADCTGRHFHRYLKCLEAPIEFSAPVRVLFKFTLLGQFMSFLGDLFSQTRSLARYRFENKSPKNFFAKKQDNNVTTVKMSRQSPPFEEQREQTRYESCDTVSLISWIACLPRWRVNEHPPFFDTQSKNGVLESGCPVGTHTLAMTERNTSKVKRCNKNVKNCSPLTVHSSLNNETNFSRFTSHFSLPQKPAFTMAEVLITLGIIGIVAAMTFPTLIQNQKEKVLCTKLQKFYNIMNQAIMLAENVYGDRESWFDETSYGVDADGNSLKKVWLDMYLGKYLNIVKTEEFNGGRVIYYLADGGAFMNTTSTNGNDWIFFPGDPKRCLKKYNNSVASSAGKCGFYFYYRPLRRSSGHIGLGARFREFAPYSYDWDGTKSDLYNHSRWGCSNNVSDGAYFCTLLIQYNGWKVPKDYPFKFDF